MAYQPFTITGSGGFSKVNDPKTHSGSVTCLAGFCYVRLLKTPDAGITSGANANIVGPSGSGFDDGWALLGEGDAMSFGQEIVNGSTQSIADPVGQIDIYIPEDAEVSCLQH